MARNYDQRSNAASYLTRIIAAIEVALEFVQKIVGWHTVEHFAA